MKVGSVFYALSISAALVFGAGAQTSSPDDLYLEAYRLIQEADGLTQTGQAEAARRRYNDAEANLKKIQTTNPTYNKNAVEFRLEYVQERLKAIPQKEQPARPETKPVNPNDPKALQQRIAQTEADNEMLQAKLREALSARPAEVDPGQFAKSQER